MTRVRPTLKVLKAMIKAGLFPPDLAKRWESATSGTDQKAKFERLSRIDIEELDIPLLRSARSDFSKGFPDRHRQLSELAGEPVYEIRGRSGAAWRAAAVLRNEVAWIVHADKHDQFHSESGNVIRSQRSSGNLGPREIDLLLLEAQSGGPVLDSTLRKVFEALLSALEESFALGGEVSVGLPPVPDLAETEIILSLTSVDSEMADQ